MIEGDVCRGLSQKNQAASEVRSVDPRERVIGYQHVVCILSVRFHLIIDDEPCHV